MAQTSHTHSHGFKLIFAIPALLMICGVALAFRPGSFPLLGPDEPRYCEVAREMYDSGDWITPNLAGIHWFEKPALAYWLIATGYSIGGVSETSARIPLAVFSAFGIFILFWFGCRIESGRLGYLGASVLASSGIWIAFSRAATFDLPLSVSVEIALLAFFLWFREGSWKWWLISCFGMGLAVLAKGLVGIVLPGMAIVVVLILTRRIWSFLRHPVWIALGALVFLATAATWYGPMFLRHGHEFFQEFFVAHHFQRFLTNKYHHPQPFYFFTMVLFAGCFPWTLFLGASAWSGLRNWKQLLSGKDPLDLLLWIWIITFVGFFSISTSKLTGYILPAFPAAALLVGRQLNIWWEHRPRTLWRWLSLLTGITIGLLAILPFSKINKLPATTEMQLVWLGCVLALLGLLLVTLTILFSEKIATLGFAPALAVVIAMASLCLSGAIEGSDSTASMIQDIKLAAKPGEKMVFYINNHHSVDFYAPQLPLRDEKSELVTPMTPEELAPLLKASPTGSLILASPQQWVSQLSGFELEDITSYRTWKVVRIKPGR